MKTVLDSVRLVFYFYRQDLFEPFTGGIGSEAWDLQGQRIRRICPLSSTHRNVQR
jgi:hypothetical protein